MTASPATETIIANRLYADATDRWPVLSVVSPTYKFCPKRMLDALATEAATLPVELILIDDGSADPDLARSLRQQIEAFPAPAKLILLHSNAGRSAARNRLIKDARAPYLLFMDSDMLPDRADFLGAWLRLIEHTEPAVAYGGFSTLQASTAPEYRLARALAERMDCQNAAERTKRGGVAVATSNLLVRADVMAAVPFDHGFAGWGWEDAEWAIRASGQFDVIHVDISATHLGLDQAAVILSKFKQAGPNFALAAQRHPQILLTAGSQIAVKLAAFPAGLLNLLKPVLHLIALSEALPVSWRSASARLWRAVFAAEGIRKLGTGPK
jgi:glycosyltransferase involved in cell wall biosynthesis